MRLLLLARHAHALSNQEHTVSGRPPGDGLTPRGIEEARALREAVAGEEIDLGVASELVRTQETLALALGDRPVPRVVLPEWNEIDFGCFEACSLDDYRTWAWTAGPAAPCPGDGESRGAAAARYARALETLLARPEDVILAVGHALPIRYVVDAADGRLPLARLEPIGHAETHRLDAAGVRTAADFLLAWSESPRFAAHPIEGRV